MKKEMINEEESKAITTEGTEESQRVSHKAAKTQRKD